MIGLRWDFEFGVFVNVLIIVIDLERNIGITILSFFLFDVWLSNHGMFSTSFLMGYQRLIVELSATVLTLNQSLFHVSVEGTAVHIDDIIFGDFVFGKKSLQTLGRSGTGSSLLERFEIFFIFPFLLARFDMNWKRLRSKLSATYVADQCNRTIH